MQPLCAVDEAHEPAFPVTMLCVSSHRLPEQQVHQRTSDDHHRYARPLCSLCWSSGSSEEAVSRRWTTRKLRSVELK